MTHELIWPEIKKIMERLDKIEERLFALEGNTLPRNAIGKDVPFSEQLGLPEYYEQTAGDIKQDKKVCGVNDTCLFATIPPSSTVITLISRVLPNLGITRVP